LHYHVVPGDLVSRSRTDDDKRRSLRRDRALNPQPQAVTDAAFRSGNAFFDAHDLVQAKYEMLRRVRQDGQTVSHAAAAFGLSRPSFYVAQALFERGGLPALVPRSPGPKRAHKLSAEVVDFLEHTLERDPALRAPQLARLVQEQFSLVVHPRSVERALARRRKKGL
jgi:transposase